MSETTIKTCTCKSAFQDEKYGKDKRVHNKKTNGGSKCSVCGKDKS